MLHSVKIVVRFPAKVISNSVKSRFDTVRNYSRWVHRRHVRVFQPEEYDEVKQGKKRETSVKNVQQNPFVCQKSVSVAENVVDYDADTNDTSFAESDDVKMRISTYEKHLEEPSTAKGSGKKLQLKKLAENVTTKFHSGIELPAFIKLNDDDTLLSNLMTSVKSKKQREKTGYILLEGKRLIADSIAAGVIPQYVFFSRVDDIANLKLPRQGVKIYKIPYKTISLWSEVSTSQGVVAFCKIPSSMELLPLSEALPLTIVCDNVREPGNLGTILRTAVGVGCRQVVLTKGCIDLWDPKVLRSGVGAHFRVKIFRDVTWEEVIDILDDGFVCVADNRVNNVSRTSAGEDEDGGERNQEGEEEKVAKSAELSASAEARTSLVNSDALPVVPYYDIDYTKQTSVVLVVGGETEGLSTHSYKLALGRKGVRINIPLSNGMESLNTGTAFGVIVFEMKRQFISKLGYE